jgi:hypothetical protein
MEALRTLQVRITGERNKQSLRPQDLDIDELIKALEYILGTEKFGRKAQTRRMSICRHEVMFGPKLLRRRYSRDLIAPDGKSRPNILVEVEEGSVLLKLTTAAMLVISTQALLTEVQKTFNKAILAPKQAAALSYFDTLAQKEGFDISFGTTTEEPALKINRETVWADAPEEAESDYLNRLIEEATPHWVSIGDTDAWLKSVRAHNDQLYPTSSNPSI